MRRLSEISEQLVSVGDYWWGKLFWIEGGPIGFDVRQFNEPALLRAYTGLLEAAFIWAHADWYAWQMVVIQAPDEIGADFVSIRRFTGVSIEKFYPEHTDDPVVPPVEKLASLTETIARMRVEAQTPREKLLAEMLGKRLAALDYHIVYNDNEGEERFHLWDLDPSAEELAAWMAAPPDPPYVPAS